MRRLRRWLFDGVAVLSLVLCIAVGVIWVAGVNKHSQIHSISQQYGWFWAIEPNGWRSAELMVEFYHFWPTPIVGPMSGPQRTYTQEDLNWMKQFRSRKAFYRGGYEVGQMPLNSTNSAGRLIMDGYTYWIGVPDWFAMLALAVLSVVAWRRRRRALERERKERGECMVCGYDLRATPERCPECGSLAKESV
jgi:hypothetical protein